ncbi:hypothetical protein T265_16263, partial [Opisthorchis viverrini]
MNDRVNTCVIKCVEMSQAMQQEAIAVSTTALQEYNIEKDVAKYIKKEVELLFFYSDPDDSSMQRACRNYRRSLCLAYMSIFFVELLSLSCTARDFPMTFVL